MPASDNGRFITGTKARKPRTEIPSFYQDAGTVSRRRDRSCRKGLFPRLACEVRVITGGAYRGSPGWMIRCR